MTDSFADLMARLRLAENAAAAELHARFVRRLVALAHARLEAVSPAKADPEDVVQSAFRSFFRRNQAGNFEISTWDSLWALLAMITVRKCSARRKWLGAQRRDAAREQPWGNEHDQPNQFAALDCEPTPEQ